jgi:hypothetical protein
MHADIVLLPPVAASERKHGTCVNRRIRPQAEANQAPQTLEVHFYNYISVRYVKVIGYGPRIPALLAINMRVNWPY